MTLEGYAVACTWAALAPLEVRAGLLGFLASSEPSPADVRAAVIQAHLSGLLRHNALTPEGVQAVREALSRVVDPPGSERMVD